MGPFLKAGIGETGNFGRGNGESANRRKKNVPSCAPFRPPNDRHRLNTTCAWPCINVLHPWADAGSSLTRIDISRSMGAFGCPLAYQRFQKEETEPCRYSPVEMPNCTMKNMERDFRYC